MEEKKLSPYLILLPDDPDAQKDVLSTIFGSKIAQEIILNIDSGVIFQRDLIKKLKYSNKTILVYLKKLAELNILKEDFTIVEGHRLLYYKLKKMGEWFSSLIVYKKYEPEEFKQKIGTLFTVYLEHAIGLLLQYGFTQEKLRDIFEYTLSSHLKEHYITKTTMARYVGGIESLSNELQQIISSLESLDEEKKNKLLKINELKNLFTDFNEFYGILKNLLQKINENLKNAEI